MTQHIVATICCEHTCMQSFAARNSEHFVGERFIYTVNEIVARLGELCCI